MLASQIEVEMARIAGQKANLLGLTASFEQAKTDSAQRRRLLLASAAVLLLLGVAGSLCEMVSVYVTQYLAFAILRGVRQPAFLPGSVRA